ncbi:hypothetical protein LV779_01725 [Streptomyces thinghirensis]|nr:hypothetical protein [Streptomyces thinghirensis]
MNAPVSYASLLPGAPEMVIEEADAVLRRHLGFSLPTELAALWRICGGVEHQEIAGDEEGEAGSGVPARRGDHVPLDALRPGCRTIPAPTGGGAPVVPWLTGDEAGPESGHWAGDIGVGRWSLDSLTASGRRPRTRRSPPTWRRCTAR